MLHSGREYIVRLNPLNLRQLPAGSTQPFNQGNKAVQEVIIISLLHQSRISVQATPRTQCEGCGGAHGRSGTSGVDGAVPRRFRVPSADRPPDYTRAVPSREIKAKFIEPMLLLPAETLPQGPGWTYELKLDGFRAIGLKTGGTVRLRSRNDKDFNRKYPAIAKALAALPDETVVDGEVVALEPDGRPSFNVLQNGSAQAVIVYY